METRKIFYEINKYLSRIQTRNYVSALELSGIVCLSLITIFADNPKSVCRDILFSSGFFLWGMSGLVIALRKEADFILLSFEGISAVLFGVVVSILSFAIALLPVYRLIY